MKLIFGIFAHPDDEAFGPSGALLMDVKNGALLHLVTLTYGGAGTNPDNHENLVALREQEWRSAGQLIGASDMHFLGYNDGELNNLVLIEAGEKIVALVKRVINETEKRLPDGETLEIEFMTSDLNGITGHIDHIVAARAACWAFYRLKETDPRFTRIRLSCIPKNDLPLHNTHWLYMEAGRDEREIGEVVDARQYRDEIIAIMRAHHSQRGDGETHIVRRGDALGLYSFIVKT